MDEMFTEEIIGKTAMTPAGYPIGRVEDIVIDTETGAIVYLLINNTTNAVTTQKIDSRGRSVVQISTMKISGNNIIIS